MVDTSTMLDIGALAANIPGIPTPIGNMVSIGVAPIQGNLQAEKEREELNEALGMDIKHAKAKSPGIRKKLKAMANYWQDRTMEAVVSLAGGAAGMMAVSMIPMALPWGVPLVLGIIGAIGGSILANRAYNAAFPRQDQDAAIITMQLCKTQEAGGRVSAESVFAALAANLPGRSGKRLEKELEKLTGTRDFSVALNEGHTDALHHLMKKHESVISAYYPQMHGPAHNLEETMSERYAKLINAGKMRARDLLMPDNLRALSMALEHQALMPGMDVSIAHKPDIALPPMSPTKKRGGPQLFAS